MQTHKEQTHVSKTETTLSSVDTRGSWPISKLRRDSFNICGSELFNRLPENLRNMEYTMETFKEKMTIIRTRESKDVFKAWNQ